MQKDIAGYVATALKNRNSAKISMEMLTHQLPRRVTGRRELKRSARKK